MKAQQQGLYSNFLLNQVVYNPAYAGVVPGKQFNASYRNQWTGFEGAPKTIAVNGYGNMRSKPNVALGGAVFSEKLGLIDYTSFYGIFSYHLKINKKAAVNFGIGAGAVQYSVRAFNARPYDKDDAFLANGVLNALSFDANAGMYFYTKHFFLGFSNQHMPNSKIRWSNSLGKLTPTFYLYSGYTINFGKKDIWQVQPSVLVRSNSPAPYQLEGNLKVMYKEIVWLSANYRNKATMGASAGVMLDKQFSVAYSYDWTTSAVSAYVGATHEVFLSYQIPFTKKKSKSEQIQDADEQELNSVENRKTTIKGKKEDEKPKEQPK
jgi:type IX secretion system PorP/SprF family membrane protein